MKGIKYIIFAISCLMLAACSDVKDIVEDEPQVPESPTNSKLEPLERVNFTPEQETANEAINSLAYDILDKSVAATPGENVSVSPVSVAICLGMIGNSADEKTASSIANLFGRNDIVAINDVCNQLLRYLPAQGNGADMVIANSVWHDYSLPVTESYVENMRKIFGADIISADFADNSIISLINAWCSKHTNGLIPTIIEQMPEKESVSWINALYFGGVWDRPFDKSLTDKAQFIGIKESAEVAMMHKAYTGYYYHSEMYDAARIYFKGETTYLTLYLPREGVGLSELLSDIKDGSATAALADIDLSVPRFAVDTKVDMLKMLREMGVNVSNMALTPMGINVTGKLTQFFQKNAVSFDEDGAEAAAVTYGGWDSAGPDMCEPVKIALTFDRPFVYTITNRSTGSIILAGYIANL